MANQSYDCGRAAAGTTLFIVGIGNLNGQSGTGNGQEDVVNTAAEVI